MCHFILLAGKPLVEPVFREGECNSVLCPQVAFIITVATLQRDQY